MKEKILIVYNIFGKNLFFKKQMNFYEKSLNSIFKQIENYKDKDIFRVVVNANCVPDHILYSLKRRFEDKITIFHMPKRFMLPITFNKTCLYAEEYFNERYKAYQYTTSGVVIPENLDLYNKVVDKLYSDEYGMIGLQVSCDTGYNWLGHDFDYEKHIDFSKDYDIPVGCTYNMACGFFHNSLRDFYGKPLSDVYGYFNQEQTFSYAVYALRKKFILLGDSIISETSQSDMFNYCDQPLPEEYQKNKWYPLLLYGRTYEDTFLADHEGLDAGLGHFSNRNIPSIVAWGGFPLKYVIDPKMEKYDENYFSNDERLKHSVKRNYFLRNDEINYDEIVVDVI